jgi:D-3-phosphoglycerate dehydrogenase / 2-oxoglutarate reductase
VGVGEIIDRRVAHLTIWMQDRLLDLFGRQSHRMALPGWQRLLSLVYIIPVRFGSMRRRLPTEAASLADTANLTLRHPVYGETAVRVLVADSFEQAGLGALQSLGCEVLYEPNLTDQRLQDAVHNRQADVLVVRSTPVSAGVFAAPSLKLVVRAGAGYNTIDVVAASKRGVYVANCPGQNSVAVSELAFGLILALDRRIVDSVISLRAGTWNKTEFSKARGLHGRTLGLIGMGRIAQQMIPRAAAFGMPVIAWSRNLTPQRAASLGVEHRQSILDVAADADIVSVHLALAPETRGLIGTEFFSSMRPGAYFINTARGEVVDQAALLAAVHEHRIRAGLDVYGCEPKTGVAEFTDPIAQETGFCGTPHIGAATEQAQEAIAVETVRIIGSFMQRAIVPNAVNIAGHTTARCLLTVRHQDQPGVLARILDAISAQRINVQEMENVVFEGAEAAVAHIHLELAPPAEMLDTLRRNEPHVFEITLTMLSDVPAENELA